MKMQSVILAEFFCIPWSYITLNCAPLASLNMLIQVCQVPGHQTDDS